MKELIEFLELLGLTDDDIKVYIFLLQQGGSTVLEVSRGVHINRTALYRLCERLTEKGYLKKITELNTTKYEASSVEFLKTKIQSKKQQVTELESHFEKVKEISKKVLSLASTKIKVIHYSGKEEAKQLLWNYIDAEINPCSFGYKTMTMFIDAEFIINWWNELYKRFAKRGLKERFLANPGTFEMKNRIDTNTKMKFLDFPEKMSKLRVVDEKIFKIYYETFIYNDVYAILQWDKNKIFGVEIYNQFVADQEHEIFDVLWKMAKPV